MNKLFLFFLFLILSSSGRAEVCSQVSFLEGQTCDTLKVKFDLSKCEGLEPQIRTSKCWNEKAVAQVKVGQSRHIATFIRDKTQWKLASIRVDGILESVRVPASVVTPARAAKAKKSENRESSKTVRPALRPLDEL